MQEKKKDIKRELIEKGKKKGVLTFKEISDAFEDIEVTPEEIRFLSSKDRWNACNHSEE